MTPTEVYSTLSAVWPVDSVLVTESTSTMAEQREWLPTIRSGSFYATASGGIGWGVPAAVGVALGDRASGAHGGRHHRRRIVPILGAGDMDGRST
jgi:benzoylformate decarboxylase